MTAGGDVAALSGQKVVVFGGGSGVGLASARLCAAHGAEVVVTGRSADKLDAATRGSEGRITSRAVDGKVTTSFVTGTVLAVDGGLPHASL